MYCGSKSGKLAVVCLRLSDIETEREHFLEYAHIHYFAYL